MNTTATTTLLAGASGLIGNEVAAQWRGPGPLLQLVRRPLPGSRQPTLVVDFAALPALPAARAAICCLGTTIKAAGSQQAFRAVDFDAVLGFARAARAAGAQRLEVVSALGADPKSANFYLRVKGQMEAALRELGFPNLVIVRPSLLLGDRKALGQALRPAETIASRLAAPLSLLLPLQWRPISAATVARALLRERAAPQAAATRVIESRELRRLGAP